MLIPLVLTAAMLPQPWTLQGRATPQGPKAFALGWVGGHTAQNPPQESRKILILFSFLGEKLFELLKGYDKALQHLVFLVIDEEDFHPLGQWIECPVRRPDFDSGLAAGAAGRLEESFHSFLLLSESLEGFSDVFQRHPLTLKIILASPECSRGSYLMRYGLDHLLASFLNEDLHFSPSSF
ncbi:hypothetical protein KKG24_04300 [Patescibacteria group bacterium]|nr:hypothetical protein [Patescibacteria group bacterium]